MKSNQIIKRNEPFGSQPITTLRIRKLQFIAAVVPQLAQTNATSTSVNHNIWAKLKREIDKQHIKARLKEKLRIKTVVLLGLQHSTSSTIYTLL